MNFLSWGAVNTTTCTNYKSDSACLLLCVDKQCLWREVPMYRSILKNMKSNKTTFETFIIYRFWIERQLSMDLINTNNYCFNILHTGYIALRTKSKIRNGLYFIPSNLNFVILCQPRYEQMKIAKVYQA